MSKKITNDDFVVQGMATPLVFSAFLLAKATHAPGVQFMYTVGNTISENSGKLSLTNLEKNNMENVLKYVSMSQMHMEIVPSLLAKEFMRPAQIDKYGNTNNVVIGDYHSPKVRLPGSAGIGDVLSFNYNIYYYVTNHSKRTLVDQLDFCSAVGYGEREAELNKMGKVKRGPQLLITDKCIFHFDNGEAELLSIHEHSSLEDVVKNTGFSFSIPEGGVPYTNPPSEEELRILKEEVDPLNLRKLEFLSGSKRLEHIEFILEKEEKYVY
jgi:glutaconate CoA-transferase, subunit B